MFCLHSEGTSAGSNSTMMSSLIFSGDRDFVSLEEEKFQKMMSDIGRKKASVNKYRGHVPPLGKAKERSLSPISKRRQLHDTMREQMVTKVLEGKPQNGFTQPKATEVKKWKQIPLGPRRPRGNCPEKVAGSQNMAGFPRVPGAPYETKPFELLPPIPPKPVEKKDKQVKDQNDQPSMKVKRGIIHVRHTKKSAQVESRMKAKRNSYNAHAQSAAPRARQPIVNEVPGTSGKKQTSSTFSELSVKKKSSTCIAASDWSTTCIASTTPFRNESALSIPSMSKLIRTLKGQSSTPNAAINGSHASSHSEKSPVDLIAVETKASMEKGFDRFINCETPQSASGKTASEPADIEASCDRKASASSLPISVKSRRSRKEERSPSSSAFRSPQSRKVLRCVSKRSRRDRRSKSRSLSPVRVTEDAKPSSIGSHRSGNERVGSTYSRRISGLASPRSVSKLSRGRLRSRSRSPLSCKSSTRLSDHRSSRSGKKSLSSSLSTYREVSPTYSSRSISHISICHSSRTGSRASVKSSNTSAVSSSRCVSQRSRRDCGSRSRSPSKVRTKSSSISTSHRPGKGSAARGGKSSMPPSYSSRCDSRSSLISQRSGTASAGNDTESSRSTDSKRIMSSMSSRTAGGLCRRSPRDRRLTQRSPSPRRDYSPVKSNRQSTASSKSTRKSAPCTQPRYETHTLKKTVISNSPAPCSVKRSASIVKSGSGLSQTKDCASSSLSPSNRTIRNETESSSSDERSASSSTTKRQLGYVSTSFSGLNSLRSGNSNTSSDKLTRPSTQSKSSTTRPFSSIKSLESARKSKEGSCPTQIVSVRRIKSAGPLSSTSVKSCHSIEKQPLMSLTKSTSSRKSTVSSCESTRRPVSSRIVVSSRSSASATSKSTRSNTSTTSFTSPPACTGALTKRSVTPSSHTTPRSDILPATPVKLKRNPTRTYSSRSNVSTSSGLSAEF